MLHISEHLATQWAFRVVLTGAVVSLANIGLATIHGDGGAGVATVKSVTVTIPVRSSFPGLNGKVANMVHAPGLGQITIFNQLIQLVLIF